jgi:anti-sigma factor RsiW
MRIFRVECQAAEQRMADLFTGELRAREQLELEAHADGCARCNAALRDLATISVALDRAYAPLRQRGALLSPARVRLAARASPNASIPWWRVGFVGRLSEATMALAFAALVVGGSLDVAVKPDVAVKAEAATSSEPSVIRTYMRTQPPAEETAYLRWFRVRFRTIVADPLPALPSRGRFDVEQVLE